MPANAYEIRHSLLGEARDMLFTVWHQKCEVVRYNANTEDRAVGADEMPAAPTFDEILELARKMNAFVSEK